MWTLQYAHPRALVGSTGGGFDPKPFKLTLLQQHGASSGCGRAGLTQRAPPALSAHRPQRSPQRSHVGLPKEVAWDAHPGCPLLPNAARACEEESLLTWGGLVCEPHAQLARYV